MKAPSRAGVDLQLALVRGTHTFLLGSLRTNDDRVESRDAFTSARYDIVSDWSVGERTSIYGFYTHERPVDAATDLSKPVRLDVCESLVSINDSWLTKLKLPQQRQRR